MTKKKLEVTEEVTETTVVEEYGVVDAPEQDTFNEEDMRIEGEVENDASKDE